MSITKSYDVWCDWPGCSLWTHGVVAAVGRSGRASNEARYQARRDGWRRKKMGGEWADLCPRHAKSAS